MWPLLCPGWNREIKGRAAVHHAFSPDPAAVAMDDASHIRQADAGALELAGRVQPLEHTEQFVGIAHVKPDAVVADKENRFIVGMHGPDLDLRFFARAGVLEGVG